MPRHADPRRPPAPRADTREGRREAGASTATTWSTTTTQRHRRPRPAHTALSPAPTPADRPPEPRPQATNTPDPAHTPHPPGPYPPAGGWSTSSAAPRGSQPQPTAPRRTAATATPRTFTRAVRFAARERHNTAERHDRRTANTRKPQAQQPSTRGWGVPPAGRGTRTAGEGCEPRRTLKHASKDQQRRWCGV